MTMSPNARRAARAVAALWLAVLAAAAPALEAPIKSPNDRRDYAFVQLDNGLLALVISDPAADKAAAALDVGVGSSADPDDRQGLAHFLEHMLFLGTRKYPQAEEYQGFITQHGGTHNAFTAFEDTNYFFDIDHAHLEPALDRFSQFFVAPLFDAQYVEREKNAVHSEYQAKLKDDMRRVYAAMQQATNPRHPASRFAVGSLETLADRPGRVLRDELLQFYETHYTARSMRLVVIGREPTSTLAAWVREKFSPVPDRRIPAAPIREPLFAAGTLPARLDVVPEKNARSLKLMFPIPPLQAHYRERPADYVANLLGHEGEGSLLSLLKHLGWADGLSAGVGLDNRDSAMFSIDIALTEAGATHVDDIVAHAFGALRAIRERGVDAWRFEEDRRLLDLRFQFQEKAAAVEDASEIAGRMQRYDAADVLRAPYIADRWDASLIRTYLDRLVPENVLVTFVSPQARTDRTEPWYGTRFALAPPAAAALAAWQAASPDARLALPEPNAFIPQRVALLDVEEPAQIPARVQESARVQLWHHADTSFGEPRASFYLSIRSPAANDSAAHAVLTELYVRMVKDQLNEFAYPATLAGLSYDLYRHVRGISLKIAGFEDKQPTLLRAVLARLREPTIDPSRFAVIRDALRRELENSRKEAPYTQVYREVANLMVRPSWTIEERLAALADLGPEDLRAFVTLLLARIEPVALAHGNIDRSQALAAANLAADSLLGRQSPIEVAPGRVVRIEPGQYFGRQMQIEHPDSAVAGYIQGPDKSYRSRALMELLGQIISSPYYTSLRTEQQLGYVVFAGPSPLLDVPGLVFVVQSPVADPDTIQARTQDFLKQFRARLASMDDGEFAAHKAGVTTRILQAEERLQERSDRYWSEIDLGRTQFDSRPALAAAVNAIDRTTLVDFFDRDIAGSDARRLLVLSVGRNHAAAVAAAAPAFTPIASAATFADGRPAYAAGAYPDPLAADPRAPGTGRAPSGKMSPGSQF
ncbi:MAG: insulinase family protein [Gammaproteobacteria bacterium]